MDKEEKLIFIRIADELSMIRNAINYQNKLLERKVDIDSEND